MSPILITPREESMNEGDRSYLLVLRILCVFAVDKRAPSWFLRDHRYPFMDTASTPRRAGPNMIYWTFLLRRSSSFRHRTVNGVSVNRVNQQIYKNGSLYLACFPFLSTGSRGWSRRVDARAAQIPGRSRRDQDLATEQPEIPNVSQRYH